MVTRLSSVCANNGNQKAEVPIPFFLPCAMSKRVEKNGIQTQVRNRNDASLDPSQPKTQPSRLIFCRLVHALDHLYPTFKYKPTDKQLLHVDIENNTRHEGYVPRYQRSTDEDSSSNRQGSRKFRVIEHNPSTPLSDTHIVGRLFRKYTNTPPQRDVLVPNTIYMVKLYCTYGGARISCIDAIPNSN